MRIPLLVSYLLVVQHPQRARSAFRRRRAWLRLFAGPAAAEHRERRGEGEGEFKDSLKAELAKVHALIYGLTINDDDDEK